MKIAIVGAGAMGSLFGALLAESGADVWLLDIWADHVNTMIQKGLRVEHEGKTRTVPINATTDVAQIEPADLVLIFVKSTHTSAAAETAAKLIKSDGIVMTLQNGMGNADTIAEAIAPARILVGTTSHGATLLGPGKIRHAGTGPTIIGMWAAGEDSWIRAHKIAEFFTRAGIDTEAVTDVSSVVWNKLLINVGINAITALTGIKNGQLLDLEATREISRAAVKEAMVVAHAQEVKIREDAVDHVFMVAEATGSNRSSMGQDIDNRRPTEIAAINGFIVREAKRLGLEAPVNFALTALVETLQFHYR